MSDHKYPWEQMCTNYEDFDAFEKSERLEAKLQTSTQKFDKLRSMSESTFDQLQNDLKKEKHKNQQLNNELQQLKKETKHSLNNSLQELENVILTNYVNLKGKDVPQSQIAKKVLRRTYNFLKQRAKTLKYIKKHNIFLDRVENLEKCLLTTREQLTTMIDNSINA